MWFVCFAVSITFLIVTAVFSLMINTIVKKNRTNSFNILLVAVFISAMVMFLPIHYVTEEVSLLGMCRMSLLSVFNALQLFTFGCEFSVVQSSISFCPENFQIIYQVWAAALYVLAPIFTFGFVLSLFKNLSAYIKYLSVYFQKTYIFSELNNKSLTLANDIKKKNPKAAIVFNDVFENNEEGTYELIEKAKELGAICFKKDILVINFSRHSSSQSLMFFAIGSNEAENLNQAIKLIEIYKNRKHTHVYVFSVNIESEVLLTTIDKGNVKVRRINEVQSLVNRVLYEEGNILFESARENEEGLKCISAVVIGMGHHGTEMVKALSWFGQMDGYRLEINAFDKDPLAEEKFIAIAPELMSPQYNGVYIEGESQYKITIHPRNDVASISFVNELSKIRNASYVFVSLGNDDININTAVKLRMYFERMNIHPVIQAIVYNSEQKRALQGIKNYRGQAYDIDFIGDLESSYTENVIIDSELENDALKRHLKWGNEEEFWAYEYNYRSSTASAIHMKARIKCGMPGANKKEEELTTEERDFIEVLEHRRWNAYMRSEGYIYSGSKKKSSRNDLAKMHHNLVDFESLSEKDKRKDSQVGSN